MLLGDVNSDSPAEKAELKVGDIIVHFNGKPVVDAKTLDESFTEETLQKGIRIQVLVNGTRKFLFLRNRSTWFR